MYQHRLSVVRAVLFAIGCALTPACSTPSTSALEAAADRVLTDESGESIAQAVRDHVPTDAELALTAAFWAAVLESRSTGELHPLPRRGDADRYFTSRAAQYSALRDAAAIDDGLGSMSAPLISDPPACTDDCLPGAELAEPYIERVNELREQAHDIADRILPTDGESDSLTDEEAEALAMRVPRSQRDQFLNEVGRTAAGATLIARALALGVAAEVGSATLAIVGAVKVARATKAAVRRGVAAYRACAAWKAAECQSDAGTADAGASDAGGLDAGPMDASVDAGPMDASADASLDSGPDGGRDAGSGRYIDCASGPCPAPYVCALVGVRTYRCAFVQPDALCGGSLHQVVNDQWSSSRNNDICVCTEGPVCGATTTSWRPLLDDHNSADCTSVCGG